MKTRLLSLTEQRLYVGTQGGNLQVTESVAELLMQMKLDSFVIKHHSEKHARLHRIFTLAAQYGRLRILLHLQSLGYSHETNSQHALYTAVRHGQLNSVFLFRRSIFPDSTQLVAIACRYGHKKILCLLKHFIRINAENVLHDVAAGSSSSTMKLLNRWFKYEHIKYTDELNRALFTAALHGRMKAIKLLQKWGATNYHKMLRGAIEGGHLHIVKLAVRNMRCVYAEEMLFGASRYGHLHIMQYAKNCGAVNFNTALEGAAIGGQVQTAKLLKEWGATDFDKSLRFALRHNKPPMAAQLREWGANEPQEIPITRQPLPWD